MRFCVALASILASTGSSSWPPLPPSVDDANRDEALRVKDKFHVKANKMQNGKKEEDEDQQDKDHNDESLPSVESFRGCDPSATATTPTGTATNINSFESSTKKEEIDNGHLRHHNDDGSCSSPDEVCVAKTHPAVSKIVDSLTQQEDTLYDEGICVHVSYIEGEWQEELQQQETVSDHSGSHNHIAITSDHYHDIGYAVNNNINDVDGGYKKDDDGKENQRQQLEDDETDIMADTTVTQAHYHHAVIYNHDEYNHGINPNQIGFDNYHVSPEHRQLTSRSDYCTANCLVRPKVDNKGLSLRSLVDFCARTIPSTFCPQKFLPTVTTIGCWDVSEVTNMYQIFSYSSLNEPLKCWDVSQVTTMYQMFYEASNFNQDINDWNVGRVKSMFKTFVRSYKFNRPLEDWNVSSVGAMDKMFYKSKSFNQPLDAWNVIEVLNFSFMFKGAESFNQCLSTWASKSQRCSLTTGMFSSSSCPDKTPDCNEGPWCQDEASGCVLRTSEPSLSDSPSSLPSSSQQPSAVPSIDPSDSPSSFPSSSKIPSVSPSAEPSLDPSIDTSSTPSVNPSAEPSLDPSVEPSSIPSVSPSAELSLDPSVEPSSAPSSDTCLDDIDFRFKVQKKNGKVVDLGGCSSYVAKKAKKRCTKMVGKDLVQDKCPVTCALTKCTCKDQTKVIFSFGNNKKKKLKRRCLTLNRKFCVLPKVQEACPTRC